MIPWIITCQAPLWFPRQEYWSGLPFPSLGYFLDPRIKPGSLHFRSILCCSATGEVPFVSSMLAWHMWALSRLSSRPSLVTELHHISHSVVSNSLWPPLTITLQAPLSMGCSRREYWSGLPWPPPGDLPDPGVEPSSPALQVGSWPYWGEITSGSETNFGLTLVKPRSTFH